MDHNYSPEIPLKSKPCGCNASKHINSNHLVIPLELAQNSAQDISLTSGGCGSACGNQPGANILLDPFSYRSSRTIPKSDFPINVPHPAATELQGVSKPQVASTVQNYKPASRHLMIIPSLACQAKCVYCFGPNRGSIMQPEVFEAAIDWIDLTTPSDEKVDITFHGGEPLIPQHDWYRRNLPLLHERFGDRLKLHIQSNLWLLDDDYCKLFKEYNVSIGTSLDGPEHINDPQRGEGYFAKTMNGINTARRHGLSVGVICTFTRLSVPHYREVCEFFMKEGLGFSLHAAVCTMNSPYENGVELSPEEHTDLFITLFDYYMENITRLQISTFDAMAQGVASGNGAICTFGDCLGGHLTIGPDGGIYLCNRFAHHQDWRFGLVQDVPTVNVLAQSPRWKQVHQREQTVHQDCNGCSHFSYCKGGCAYNAFTSGTDQRDPHCGAYKRLFTHIRNRALDEVFDPKNLDAIVENGADKNGLLRKGKLLQLMRRGPHPQQAAGKAREAVSAVALAVSQTPAEAVQKLNRVGLITNSEIALQSITGLQNRLRKQSQGLANIYLHVTYACNLTCDHCYSSSGSDQTANRMTVDNVIHLVQEAAKAGFAKVIITGGEPLAHPQREALLDALAGLRDEVKPMQTVLRTNLAYTMPPSLTEKLAHSTDLLMVSVDGDKASHDARRGAGTYARIIANLHTLMAVNPSAKVGVTAVLSNAQIDGPEGEAVSRLGQELGLLVRFKPELPIGRASNKPLVAEYYSSLDDNDSFESVTYGSRTAATCGLGMNLYVGPRGECFPCHALMETGHHIGNIFENGLPTLLANRRFQSYKQVTVDSNRQCRQCEVRYLCGGFCRIWGSNDDPDAPPTDCTPLHQRARSFLINALDVLDVNVEQWRAAGLPIPDAPPRVFVK